MLARRKKISRSPSRTGVEVFVHSGDGSSPAHYLEGLKRRIRKKRIQGKRLGAVESYFAQRGLRLGSNLLGPSTAGVTLEIASAFLRPMPILAVLSLIVLAEGTTSAYFSSGRQDLRNQRLSELVAVAPYAEESALIGDYEDTRPEASEEAVEEELALQAAEEADASQPYDFERKYATAEKLHGLVEFISGVIAVYRPNEKNAGELARHIVEQSHEQQIDPLYVASVIANESSFRSKVKSRVGATGLMQVMPTTAKHISERHNVSDSRAALSDPQRNIELGISYLKHLQKNYGSRDLALQAYNWGPTNVSRARKGHKRTPASVRDYSRKILELTLRWNKHFERASESAAALSASLTQDT
jgi:soluble lytic murein transglycosylase-like protein